MQLSPTTRILVTGAAGQLAGAFIHRLKDRSQLTYLTRAELDITSATAVARTLREVHPELILNCAAYNDVDGAEAHASDAIAANGLAVGSLADGARALGATLVHYSTDFVFDPVADAGPLRETDPVRPRSVYAQSKLLGELFAKSTPRHYVLRVASLFGNSSGRSSIDKLAAALRAGGRVRAFVDRTVTPGYVHDVVEATLALVTADIPYGSYHCVNSGTTTWGELATTLARLVGADADHQVEMVPFASLVARAPRPQFPAMSNAKLAAAGVPMPSWQDALARYVADRR